MELDIRLSDGRLVGSPDLSIWNRTLRFDAQRRRDCAFAFDACTKSAGYSIVLVKNERILANVRDEPDLGKACDSAGTTLTQGYKYWHWPLPSVGVVAAICPFPKGSLLTLAGYGVDTVFAIERLRGPAPRSEESYINEWLGRHPSRPDRERRRIFVVEPFIAKK